MKILELEQNTQEWNDFRKSHIGASDIPIIMEESPFATPYQLWCLKLSLQHNEPNLAMRYGSAKESEIRERIQCQLNAEHASLNNVRDVIQEDIKEATEEPITLQPYVVQHEKYEWATASLDGIDPRYKICVEIKCAGKKDHQHVVDTLTPPKKYYGQLQWQMFVTGLDSILYYSFSDELVSILVERDDEYINKALYKAEQFLYDLKNLSAPSFTENDHIPIRDQEFYDLAERWKIARQTLTNAKQQEKFYRDKLISFCDDGNCEGAGLRLTRVKRDGTVDWDALCKERGITQNEIDIYRKPQIGYYKITEV